jgi:hypothetical protein
LEALCFKDVPVVELLEDRKRGEDGEQDVDLVGGGALVR